MIEVNTVSFGLFNQEICYTEIGAEAGFYMRLFISSTGIHREYSLAIL